MQLCNAQVLAVAQILEKKTHIPSQSIQPKGLIFTFLKKEIRIRGKVYATYFS